MRGALPRTALRNVRQAQRGLSTVLVRRKAPPKPEAEASSSTGEDLVPHMAETPKVKSERLEAKRASPNCEGRPPKRPKTPRTPSTT